MRQVVPARLLPGPDPFTGVVVAGETEYAVLALRERNLAPEAKWAFAARILVIVEDERDVIDVASRMVAPARYTADEALFTEPLHLAWWKYKNGRLERDVVRAFEGPDQKEPEAVPYGGAAERG